MAREVSISFALTAALKGGFKAAFQGAAESARNVASAIRDMEKTPVGRLGAAMSAQREKIKGLSGSLKEAREKLAALNAQAASGGTPMLARQIELADQRVRSLEGSLNRQLGAWRSTTVQAANVSGSIRMLSHDYEQLSQRMERARRVQSAMAANRAQADSLRSQRSDLNSRLAGAAATAMTVAVPMKLSIDFEDSIAQVGAVANASDEDMARLTDTARKLGRDTVFSASQAAEGMKYLAMAGFDAKETMSAMPGMLDLAAAGNTDLGRTADIASDILSSFKLKADEMGQVSDTLAKTFTTSNTSLEMLGETMKYVGPVAASVGMSLQDTSAMAGMLGNVGIKASQAGTVMRAALLRLSAPPKMAKDALGELAGVAGPELDELYEQIGDTGDAQTALQELGMTTKDEAGNLRPMVDILEELNMRTAKMGTADKAEIFKKVFGTEASAGMIALAEQAAVTVDKYGNKITNSLGEPTNALRAYMEKVNDYEGTGARIAKRMNETTGGALRRLRSAWEDTGISVGNLFLPAIQMAADALSIIGNVISGAIQRFPNLSRGIGLVVGGVMALSVAGVALGLVMNLVKTSINGWRGALLRLSASQITTTATTGAASASAGIFGVASRLAGAGARFFAGGLRSILVASGVGALLVGLGFAINMLIDNWDSVVAAMSAAWGWVTDTWGRLGVFFSELGKNLMGIFPGVWNGICGFASGAWNRVVGVWNGISGFFSRLWGGVSSAAGAVWNGLARIAVNPVQSVKAAWQGVIGFFSNIWQGVVSGASGIGQRISGLFQSAWAGVASIWNGAGSFFSGLWNGVIGIFTRARDSVAGVWKGIIGFYAALWGGVFNIAKTIWRGIFNFITRPVQTVRNAWQSVSGFFSGIWQTISGGASGIPARVTGFFRNAYSGVASIWSGITGFFSGLWRNIVSGASSIISGIGGFFATAYARAASVWAGAAAWFSGIGQRIAGVFAFSRDAIASIWNGLAGFFSGLWSGIADGFSNFWNIVTGIAASAVSRVSAVWNGIVSFFSGIGQSLVSVFAWARDSVIGVWQGVIGFFSGIWAGISSGAIGLWQNVTGFASWAFEGVAAVWNGAVAYFDAIANNISGAFIWARDSVVTVWQGIGEFFFGIWQGVSESVSGVWQNIVGMAAWAYEGVAAIWNGVVGFFSGIVEGIFGVFSGLFSWLQEKFAWVFSAIDSIGSVIGSITGAVKGAWNKAFGEDGEKSAAPAAENAKNNPVPKAAAPAASAPVAQAAPQAQEKPATQAPAKFKPVSASAVKAASPEPPKKAGRRAGGGGSRKNAATAPSARRGASGGASPSGTAQSGSGPVTIVSVAGDNSRPQTIFIPASERSQYPQGAGRIRTQAELATAAHSAAPNAARSVAQNSAPIAASPSGAVKMPAVKAASAAAAVPRALPQAPAMLSRKAVQKEETAPTSISIDLKQNFELIAQDAAAARKVLESIKPDMEALVRRALEKISSDRRRTAYAQ